MIPAARPVIGAQERAAVDRVLASGLLAQGPEVAAFEAEFSSVVADRICVAVNSGTSALHLALLAAGIGPGDEVIVPSFTFAATANAVALTGAVPVFADIEPRHFCLDPAAVEAAIGPRTRAVMPVHLYGHPSDLRRLREICERHDLLLFEDAAQAHAASMDGVPVGAWGIAGSFSFYPTKNMTTGEGGLVATADEGLARKIRLLRNQGQERRYENEIVGLNNRMTDIHAAIGRVQLRQLAGWTADRQANARFFDEYLEGVVTPAVADGAAHVYHQYTIRVVGLDRDEFAAHLAAKGVGTGVYYPIPNHRLPAFARDVDLPETERAALECLSLPVYPSLTEAEREQVATAVNDVAAAGS
ncbi:MAG: DegT/DnrJ/EryC1/StrS family aminotransferase [Actinomycetota bacterium]|nr:DegT/DnrJ/EryC1/StrS family aminotransferase [Actinomycetota bacterium]